MRVVFMGTPDFAVPSLQSIATSHDVVAVYTRPDAVSARGSAKRSSPVKSAAESLGLKVVQPSGLRDASTLESLALERPDAIVVVAFGAILPAQVLAMPRLAAINAHASLLPRWRGAAPIQRAMLAGDKTTGVSIMRMEEGLDTGPYCLQAAVPVEEKYLDELSAEIARVSAELLGTALHALETGQCSWTPQPEAGVTYAEKVGKADVALHPGLRAADAVRRVRASGPQAPSRFRIGEAGLTAIRAERSGGPLAEGEFAVGRSGLELGFSDGSVLVTRVKPDGRNAMSAADYARGAHLESSAWSGDE